MPQEEIRVYATGVKKSLRNNIPRLVFYLTRPFASNDDKAYAFAFFVADTACNSVSLSTKEKESCKKSPFSFVCINPDFYEEFMPPSTKLCQYAGIEYRHLIPCAECSPPPGGSGDGDSVSFKRPVCPMVDQHVKTTPRENENSLTALVSYLTSPYDDDYCKAKAIAYWIASRIKYDNIIKCSDDDTPCQRQSAVRLLSSRAGLAIDFANLFAIMCRKASISAHAISGNLYSVNKDTVYLTINQQTRQTHY